MSEHLIIEYLNDCANNSGDISHLLKILLHITEHKAGVVFDSELKVVEKNGVESIEISKKIYDVYRDNFRDFTADIKIKNCISFPLIVKNSFVGVVSLFNRPFDWNQNLLKQITPILSLFQIFLHNRKRESLETKDFFLANMSHEIRTPLNGVIGYNQLLSQTHLNSTQKKYLENMNKCSLQLMQIINDILDYSKLSSNKMTLKTECFRPKTIIDTALATMEQRFKSKKQKCDCTISDTVPDLVVSDKAKCIQILINLLSNSHKYTPISGKIDVNLCCEEGKLILQVKDNGIGIAEEYQKCIFEPFERIKCKDQICSGTGLGLAVTKKLCNLLGGDIRVMSTVGVGSVFTVETNYEKYIDESISKRSFKDLEDQVILIVDDNADNRIFISELIFTWKMRPIVCASALEALRLVLGNRYNFDLAIIDICMPGTTGPELAKQIKEERPLLPLIALSSLDYYVNTKDFEYVLSKPIIKRELFNAIQGSIIKNPSVFLERKSTMSISKAEDFDYSKKILIIEDIQYNRELLLSMLKNLKYENVSVSENGQDAWEKITQSKKEGSPYEILLLDLKMPKVNGFEIIERIKKRNWSLPKIIVVTASIMENDRKRCKKLGAKYFLNKPIDMKQLKQVMLYVSKLI